MESRLVVGYLAPERLEFERLGSDLIHDVSCSLCPAEPEASMESGPPVCDLEYQRLEYEASIESLGSDLIRKLSNSLCPAEPDFDRFWFPRCADYIQNMGLFKTREARNCLDKKICKVAHEPSPSSMEDYLDLYSIILRRTKGKVEDFPLKGKLKGVVFIWEDPAIRWVIDAELSGEDEDTYTLPLYDPDSTRLFRCDGNSRIGFALTLNDRSILEGTDPDVYCYEDAQVFGPAKKVSRGFFLTLNDWLDFPCLNNRLLESRVDPGDKWFVHHPNVSPLQIFAQFAVMQRGLVARIKIKVKNHPYVTSVSGSIYARPCCFAHRIPLIILGEKTEVDADGTILLKRSLVACPPHASLVIVADWLVDQYDKSVAHSAKASFIPASQARADARIMYGPKFMPTNTRLQAEVEWT